MIFGLFKDSQRKGQADKRDIDPQFQHATTNLTTPAGPQEVNLRCLNCGLVVEGGKWGARERRGLIGRCVAGWGLMFDERIGWMGWW